MCSNVLRLLSLPEQLLQAIMNSSVEWQQILSNYKGFAPVYEYVPALSLSEA